MLTIDNISWDDYIVTTSYQINSVPEYSGTDYLDGWWKKHRTVVRRRVMGTVTLAMAPSAYNGFVEALKMGESDEGDHDVTIYITNEDKERSIKAYIDVEGKAAIATPAFYRQKVFFNAVLTIEER
jgi:hypothetical protein